MAGIQTLPTVTEATRAFANSDLAIVMYSRAQARLITQLHTKPYRNQTQTWDNLIADNKIIRLLNEVNTVLFAAVSQQQKSEAVRRTVQPVLNTLNPTATGIPNGTLRTHTVTRSGDMIREESARNQGKTHLILVPKAVRNCRTHTLKLTLNKVQNKPLITRPMTRSFAKRCQ